MKYLITKDLFNRDKYYELKEGQEEHLSKLIKEKRIPKHFKLNEQEVISEDILGFTNDRPEEPREDLGIRSMDDLRAWAEKQKWYRKKPLGEIEDVHQHSPTELQLSE